MLRYTGCEGRAHDDEEGKPLMRRQGARGVSVAMTTRRRGSSDAGDFGRLLDLGTTSCMAAHSLEG